MTGGPIVGIVRDRSGAPVEHARVYFIGAPGPVPDVAALTAEDGSFAVAARDEGIYTLECSAEGLAPTRATVEVGGNDDATLELRLAPA